MKKIKELSTLAGALLLSLMLCSTVQAMDETENNDTAAKADNFTLGTTIYGGIQDEDDVDIFKCTLTQSGRVTLTMTSYMKYYYIEVLDSTGERLWYTDDNKWTESLGFRKDVHTIDLEKGNYYIKVTGEVYRGSYYNDGIGSYNLQTSFKASGANMAEPNNSFSQAKTVTMGKEVKGQIALNDGFDIYKVNVSNGSFKINITSYMKYYTICIYDSMAKEVWYTDDNEWNESMQKRVDVHYPKLEKGNYYIKITGGRRRSWDSYIDSTGNYSFKISKTASSLSINKKLNLDVKQKKKLKTTVIPSGTGEKVTYSIDNKKIATVNSSGVVTGKKAGHTTLKATVGENITAECDVFVYPLATKILNLSSTTERGLWGTKYRYIHLKCKKIKNADYYQIYYSKKKNGKYKELTTISSNSKKWISINKKGTYYIKVRTKIYSDGWYLYSDWTSPKQVKVK